MVLYLDGANGDVYLSKDEGKSWNRIDAIPSENGRYANFVPHPFDGNMASTPICPSLPTYISHHQGFVLTMGLTHYVTEDRGDNWRSFTVPSPPASGVATLAFHADPQKAGYALYHGFKCDRTFCNYEAGFTSYTGLYLP